MQELLEDIRPEESSFLVWILELDKFLKKVIDI